MITCKCGFIADDKNTNRQQALLLDWRLKSYEKVAIQMRGNGLVQLDFSLATHLALTLKQLFSCNCPLEFINSCLWHLLKKNTINAHTEQKQVPWQFDCIRSIPDRLGRLVYTEDAVQPLKQVCQDHADLNKWKKTAKSHSLGKCHLSSSKNHADTTQTRATRVSWRPESSMNHRGLIVSS